MIRTKEEDIDINSYNLHWKKFYINYNYMYMIVYLIVWDIQIELSNLIL